MIHFIRKLLIALFDKWPSENAFKRNAELSYNQGKLDGIQQGMNQRFEATEELTPVEYEEVIRFLVDRNLELCYHSDHDGFRVRKRQYSSCSYSSK